MTPNAEIRARCRSLEDDPTTPSGLTQCMLDEGHAGPHIHENMRRIKTWQDAGGVKKILDRKA